MIEIKNLSCKIDDAIVVDDVSLSVADGEILAITGQNGSGKTTLLKTVAGVLPNYKGKIFVNGKDISKMTITERAKNGLAYSFQHPVLFKGLTVQDLLEIANCDAKRIDCACQFLSKVGLCARDYLNREFNATLSGGERKRIDLALTLARNANVNIFDEPESGIDMWSFENIANIFESLRQENKSVIIVTHNPTLLKMANKVAIFDKGGKILKIGTPCELEKHLKNPSCIKLSGGAK